MIKETKLLIVDDDESIRSQMKWALVDDYEVLLAEDRASALDLVRTEKPPVICLDLGLPPHPAEVREGFRTLEEILETEPLSKVIVITGQGEKEYALKAVGQGAYDFFSKPIDIDTLKTVLQRANYLNQLERENRDLRNRSEFDSFHGMLGTSPVMGKVFSTIRKVARSEAPVLVGGESGTGKELTARAIHDLSPRSEGPFVPINCGAIPENLLESELFGHEKGSFTGAHAQQTGQIETSKGGTLFLDEVGELPLQLQVKLLRFLQDGLIQRIGGRQPIHVDTRVLAATNVDLQEAIAESQFREDLYYRLAVIVIEVPPLRDRGEDLSLLAQAFLQRYAVESRKPAHGFSVQAKRAIREYSWPGNVRELENRVRRAVIMSEKRNISLEDLGLDSKYVRFTGATLKEARESLEKEMVEAALDRQNGNMSRVAQALDISRPTLYELIEKLGIKRN